MLGNKIVLTPEPRGRRIEGVIETALYPGTVVQVKPGSELDAGNRLTWRAFDASGSGAPGLIGVLDFDWQQGKTYAEPYVAGRRGFIYFPLPGDELNMLIADLAGTGATSDFSVGDLLMVQDGTGLLIDAGIGTAQYTSRPFMAHENYSDMVGNTLLHVMFTGY